MQKQSNEILEVIIKSPRILAVGDTHFPFVDVDKALEVVKIAKDLKPNVIIQIGDLYDMYTFSRFAKSVNYITPEKELKEGRAMAVDFWKQLREASPKAKCYQLIGNHATTRIIKMALSKAPELATLLHFPLAEIMKFPGVVSMENHRSELYINDIAVIHGWSTKPGFHMSYFNQSVILGHSHLGGVVYRARKNKTIFELNCGHIADSNTLPLQYGETLTTNWVAGCGWYDDKGPRFINL